MLPCGLASSWQAAPYTCPNAGVTVMGALRGLVSEAGVAVAVDLLVLVRSRVALALAGESQRVAVSSDMAVGWKSAAVAVVKLRLPSSRS